MELKGTRHLVLAWVPIILAAMIIGGIVAVAVNTILRQLGLDIPYISEFIGSLAGALSIDALAGIDVEIGHLVHVEREFHLLPRLHRGFCFQTRRYFLA